MAAVLAVSVGMQKPALPGTAKAPAATQANGQNTAKAGAAETGAAKPGTAKPGTAKPGTEKMSAAKAGSSSSSHLPNASVSAAPATAMPATTKIVVSLEDHKLALIEDGQVKKVYTVAVGKPSTPSPVGSFTIARRVANPTYSHDGRVVPPGPHNPVGSRWMGLSIKGYGIHGTNEPRSIGKAASHGCIRMAKTDLEELYPQVAVGTTVELIGQRDEETAAIFGNPAMPASPTAQNATQLAAVHAPDAAPAHPVSNPAIATSEPVKASSIATSSVPVTGAL
jgi:lipoprotein-anchoring transpeptidase ErfK/SrfK